MSLEDYKKITAPEPAPKREIGPPKKARKPRLPSKSQAKPKGPVTFTAAILRLMACNPPRGMKIKPEERLAIDFATALRAFTIEGKLRCVWTHPANEIAGHQGRLAQMRYALAKAMGLIPGTADYLFLWKDGAGVLEAKVGKNGQQPNQIDYEAWCMEMGVPYRIFTTVDEGVAILREWGVLQECA